ncbi:MAG: hypothetical protein JSS81_05220 [Acidobacteria bacterium]|nr:hypothetical protein [Acidobacteriota bacterium]
MMIFALLASNLFPAIEFPTGKTSLIYCPLQKTWVKRLSSPKPTFTNPLDEICMSDSRKSNLAAQILLEGAFGIDEKGVFDVLQKGPQILAAYRNSPAAPKPALAGNIHLPGVSNNKKEAKPAPAPAVSKAVRAVLPLRTPDQTANLDFRTVFDLKNISRNINPRSPPLPA